MSTVIRASVRVLTCGAAGMVLWLYWWTAGAVGGLSDPTEQPIYNDYYNHLVSGFVKGHLHMDVPVSPGLMALPDPYDPAQNEPHRMTDASYYQGHYYLYFGVAPAVTLLLPYRLLTGEFLPTPWAIVIFCGIGFVAASTLFCLIGRRFFPDAPAWTAPLGVLILGIGSTAAVLTRRPFFWELASAGGFAFSMLALLSLYLASMEADPMTRPSRGGRFAKAIGPSGWMAAAGLFLGLAVASRPTYVFACPLLAIPLVLRARSNGIGRGWWRMALAGGSTVACVGVALMAYNYARFDNPFETGHNYLLSIAYESKVKLFAPAHFWFNARMYYTLPGAWSWQAPYFAPVPVTREQMPEHFYTVDDPFGILPVFPVAVFAALAPLALVRRSAQDRRYLAAVLAAVTGLYAVGTAVILLYVATIPRYAVDFFPALMLLVVVGILAATRLVSTGWSRRLMNTGMIAVSLWSVALGTLTFFDLGNLLNQRRPDLIASISRYTQHAEAWIDESRGRHYGPVEFELDFPAAGAAGHREILVRAGVEARPDDVLVEFRDGNRVRFGVRHGNSPVHWSRAVPLEERTGRRLRVELGSFYPRLEHAFFNDQPVAKVQWLLRRAELRLDGEVVLRTFLGFDPGRTGAPKQAAPEFSGVVHAVREIPAKLDRRTMDAPENLGFQLRRPTSWSAEQRLPLLYSGRGAESDLLFLEWVDATHARLGYLHGSDAPQFGATFSLLAETTRTLQLRTVETGWASPVAGNRLLLAWVDDTTVFDRWVPSFPADPDDVAIGENPAGIAGVDAAWPNLHSETVPHHPAPPGGRLILRTILPHGIKGSWLPIVSLGQQGAADSISVAYMGQNVLQFRCDHWAAPLIFGTPVPMDETLGHDIEIFLPSFAPESWGHASDGDVWVRLNGREVLRGQMTTYPFDASQVTFGYNRVRASMTDHVFRGAFIRQDWVR